MVKMSVGAAISETFAFLRANWMQMLMWLGGAVVVVCLLGWLLLRNAMMTMMMAQGDPSAAFGALGSFFLFAIVAGTIVTAASLLIWRSGLVGGEPAGDIGWGLGAGAAYMLAMIVVYIATVILMYIVLLIVGLLAFAVFGASGMSIESLSSGGASAGLIFFAILIYAAIIIFFTWFFGRLSVAGPLMAVNRSSNPFTAFGESWRLTSASQWTIVGFNIVMAILFFVFFFVVSMVLGGVMGSAMSSPDAGAGAMIVALIVALLIYVPVVLVSVSMPAAVYRCIGSKSGTDVFA
ncbi:MULTISPECIES: hypothetical protein [unclassified Sphingopyxis]|uniref:hypothetical protein n=1 Tax=unclassified Sphingopyxis TaxID=2614943 RepID=UPI0007370918|nr:MULTISPECIES: hypothetical protein [unclassified Sphingopyxis]KTE33037.1 hypothetical protein ATE62_17535 [Sphingopyxis sp. HIX]KTE83393.1 hypothetical protein ATE72_14035 [Sphingopyxis sp. HXXIV]